jgi:hypothetical protein
LPYLPEKTHLNKIRIFGAILGAIKKGLNILNAETLSAFAPPSGLEPETL